MQNHKLIILLPVWKKLIKELKLRGGGKRETGAFVLGNCDNNTVTEFICYNDLDPAAFDSGIIIFNGDGYIPLWEYCMANSLKVLAGVHTHPGHWTSQSGSDKQHPMIAVKAHIALIVPNFATGRNQLLKGVGIHEFMGNREWKEWQQTDGIVQLKK